jgi:hypothetical protein
MQSFTYSFDKVVIDWLSSRFLVDSRRYLDWSSARTGWTGESLEDCELSALEVLVAC